MPRFWKRLFKQPSSNYQLAVPRIPMSINDFAPGETNFTCAGINNKGQWLAKVPHLNVISWCECLNHQNCANHYIEVKYSCFLQSSCKNELLQSCLNLYFRIVEWSRHFTVSWQHVSVKTTFTYLRPTDILIPICDTKKVSPDMMIREW